MHLSHLTPPGNIAVGLVRDVLQFLALGVFPLLANFYRYIFCVIPSQMDTGILEILEKWKRREDKQTDRQTDKHPSRHTEFHHYLVCGNRIVFNFMIQITFDLFWLCLQKPFRNSWTNWFLSKRNVCSPRVSGASCDAADITSWHFPLNLTENVSK